VDASEDRVTVQLILNFFSLFGKCVFKITGTGKQKRRSSTPGAHVDKNLQLNVF
jgi:hypothetical protein